MNFCRFIESGKFLVCEVCKRPIRARQIKIRRICKTDLSDVCQNRGILLRTEDCKPCQNLGVVSVEIYGCKIHGECTLQTISKRKPDGTRWKPCSVCEDRSSLS